MPSKQLVIAEALVHVDYFQPQTLPDGGERTTQQLMQSTGPRIERNPSEKEVMRW